MPHCPIQSPPLVITLPPSVLSNLSQTKCPGTNSIHPYFLNTHAPAIYQSLATLLSPLFLSLPATFRRTGTCCAGKIFNLLQIKTTILLIDFQFVALSTLITPKLNRSLIIIEFIMCMVSGGVFCRCGSVIDSSSSGVNAALTDVLCQLLKFGVTLLSKASVQKVYSQSKTL